MHGKSPITKFKEGGFNPTRANFLGWLADELVTKGVDVEVPLVGSFLPGFHPGRKDGADYISRLMSFERSLEGFDGRSLVIGHDTAARSIINWLGLRHERGVNDAKAVLVAPLFDNSVGLWPPWVFDDNDSVEQAEHKRSMCRERLTIVHSGRDSKEVQGSLRWLRAEIPGLEERVVEGAGHFVTNRSLPADYCLGRFMGSTCPELLDVIEKLD